MARKWTYWRKAGNGSGHFQQRFPREYSSWRSAYSRCYNPAMESYCYYGGKGITMCDRWIQAPWVFYADMGDRPEGHTLDRIDSNGNYEPSNCRWATPSQQALNRKNRFLSREDIEAIQAKRGTMSINAAARAMGLNRNTILKYWRACVGG